MNSRLAWLPVSPFRSPRWRWLRAEWLNRHHQSLDPRIDDAWVVRTWKYLAALPEAEMRRTGISSVSPLDTAVRGALDLSQEEPPERRWQVEALLLTTEPLDVIADRCGLSVAVVEAYHELHFHVRPHLAATDWIMSQAVGTCYWQGFAGLPLGAMWKYAAYTAGPLAVDVVMAATIGQPLPDSLLPSQGVEGKYDKARLRLAAKLTTALMRAQSPAEVDALIAAHDQLRDLDQQVTGEPPSSNGLLPVMQDFLQSVIHPKRRSGKKTLDRRKSRGRTLDVGGTKQSRRRPPVVALLAGLK